jgi:hypothetical protein
VSAGAKSEVERFRWSLLCCFSGVGARSLYDCCENCHQLVCFFDEARKAICGSDISRCQKAQPVVGFPCLLARNRILRDEVDSALARLTFFDVGTNRRGGTQKLVGERSTHPGRVIEDLTKLYDAPRELKRPCWQVTPLADFTLHPSLFTLRSHASPTQYDFPKRFSILQHLVRLGDLFHRQDAVDDGVELSGFHVLEDLAELGQAAHGRAEDR